MADIVVVGSLNMDVIISVASIPQIGETILSEKVEKNPGGKGANQAVASARLGSKVAMVGKVGNDEEGDYLIDSLEKDGVDTRAIERSNNRTGTAFINVSKLGDNNIVVHPGANYDVDISQINKYKELILNSKLCILQMEIPYEVIKYTINLCFENDVKVIFNPAPASIEIDDELIAKSFILAPNETELYYLFGNKKIEGQTIENIAKEIYRKGCENLIITLGEKGGLSLNKKSLTSFNSHNVTAVDTTAAGDSFIGALASGIVEGKNLEEAIKYATAVAALTVTKHGAQNSLPTEKEVLEFIRRKNKGEI